MDFESFMCELADALGHVRRSDGAPLYMTPEQALELVRELRAERDELAAEVPSTPYWMRPEPSHD